MSDSAIVQMLVQLKSWNAHYSAGGGVSLCGQAPRQKPENYAMLAVQIPNDEPYRGFVVTTNHAVHVCSVCRRYREIEAVEAAAKAGTLSTTQA